MLGSARTAHLAITITLILAVTGTACGGSDSKATSSKVAGAAATTTEPAPSLVPAATTCKVALTDGGATALLQTDGKDPYGDDSVANTEVLTCMLDAVDLPERIRARFDAEPLGLDSWGAYSIQWSYNPPFDRKEVTLWITEDDDAASRNGVTSISLASRTCTLSSKVEDDGNTIVFDMVGEGLFGGDSYEDLTCLLDALGVPTRVRSAMLSTRALDGTLQDSWDGFEARWNYSPDSGLNLTIWIAGT